MHILKKNFRENNWRIIFSTIAFTNFLSKVVKMIKWFYKRNTQLTSSMLRHSKYSQLYDNEIKSLESNSRQLKRFKYRRFFNFVICPAPQWVEIDVHSKFKCSKFVPNSKMVARQSSESFGQCVISNFFNFWLVWIAVEAKNSASFRPGKKPRKLFRQNNSFLSKIHFT